MRRVMGCGLLRGAVLVAMIALVAFGGWWRASSGRAAPATVTFGNANSTGSNDDSDFGYINGSPGTLASAGTLSSLSVFVGSTPGGAHLRMAVYTNNGSNNPGTLITQTGEATAVSGWNTLAVPAGVQIAAGTYWIAAQTDNAQTVYKVTSGLPSGNFVGWAARAYGAFPSTVSGWQQFGLQSFDMYGTVTLAPDTTPPVITNVQSNAVTTSGATISWTTDEASTSQVAYGATTSYGSLAPASPNPALQTNHSQALSGLSASTTYHYAVLSTDASGNTATSADFSFTTPADPCTNPAQVIVCENSKPGNPASEWDVSGAGSATIQGFATDISVNRGGTVQFKVNTPATAYRLDIYRMGYYGGLGARKVATVNPSASLPQSQPACLTNSTGLYDCGNWAVSASWTVPADGVSGIYFAKLVRTDGTTGASHIFFVVRNDASASDVLFQTSDATWQAYNSYGGKSLYVGSPSRAQKVSYNRPFNTRTGDGVGGPQDFVFNAEYPMVRWLEANGYDVTYSTDVDSDRNGALIKNHRVFMSVGHDEYWSGNQRANVEAARDAGVNLAFFSGDEVAWKTRWENSIAPSGAAYRTLVTYKEPSVHDPLDPPTWTGAWRDPLGAPPADGNRPENGLTGTFGTVECCSSAISVQSAYSALRFWRNTNVATLPPGGTLSLPDGTLGYEWDESPDNGARPRGLIDLSSTTVNASSYTPMPGGASTSNVPATHNLTLYRAPSGALVFGAGTIQWPWGLDANHDGTGGAADVNMQQATVNLLADMHAQPASLAPNLVAASASTDATAPSSTITSPANGATVPPATPLTVAGSAADSGGGVVAGVEVSTDGGTTWHPATGRASWSYSFTPSATGSLTIKSRATDDSANVEIPGAGVTVTVGSSGNTATFGNAASTGSNDSSDFDFINGSPGVLSTAGTLQSVSVYVGSTPANAHVRMAVYSNNASGNPGTLLAQTGEAVAVQGWNTLPVTSAPSLSAGTYWIVAQTDNASTVYRVTGGLTSSDAVGWAAQAYGAFPASISGFAKQTGQAFDMYGTVTLGSGPTPTPSATPTSTAIASATPTTTPIGPTPTATSTPNPGVAANPILVVVNSAAPNKLGPYLTEIVKAEGFNEVQQQDLSQVTLSFLQSFDVVLLAETPLTSAQASIFNSYVSNGGNLIAMKPDAQLNATLGLSTAAGTTSEGYVKVDGSKAPGAGIYAGTMQFHGVANNYTLSGAASAATIYSDANTATSFPALTIASSGTGRAAAFAYDLARSIAYTRQGNPAFAGQERDGQTGLRASDMFDGYLDLSKLAVPQADEQSRLLANTIVELTKTKKPLPRLWYLPGQNKAVYLPTDDQDDGPASTIDQMMSDAESFGGRLTTYVTDGCYQCPANGDPVTAADVNSWRARGHTVGAHIDDAANATNPTTANMTAAQQAAISNFIASFGGPISQSVRNHWVVWVGWGQQGALESAQGIFLDHNYYTYGPWLGSNPVGYMTGSALPMLIFDDNQNATQTYGLVTEVTDEVDNANIGPDISQLFDAALGPQGYYGAIVGNVHAYRSDDPQLMHDTLVAASTRGIPIWNSDRFLKFTQMRHAATMSNVAWANNVLTFTYTASGSADMPAIMVPAMFNGAALSSVKVAGTTTAFNVQTVKGVDYAFVPVATGTSSVSATYAADTTPPVISNVQVSGVSDTSATISWTTDEPADSAVHYGVSPSTAQTASDAALVTQHSITLSGLTPNTQYSFFVSSSDAAHNPASSGTSTFPTAQSSATQTTYADFAAGTPSNVDVTEDTGGEIRLAAEMYDAFNGSSLGSGWTSTPWGAGGAATEASGALSVDGTNVGSVATFGSGRDVEANLTFGAAPFEHFGFATDLNGGPSSSWALFSTMGTTDTLFARTMLNGVEQSANLGSAAMGSAHNFRVSWQSSSVQYFIDGVLVATSATTIASPMSVHLSEFNTGGAALSSDWVRVDRYPVSPGTFVSSVIDLGASQAFDALAWTGDFPAGTSATMQTRTSTDNVTWSPWSASITSTGGAITSPTGRYIQYQATLTSVDVNITPDVASVTINYHASGGTPTPTPTPTSTPTPTPTPTVTPTPTPTGTPTPTPTPSAWWNGSFTARERLSVQTAGNAPFNGYNGYSVAVRLDTASLVSAGSLRADCNDLRVVRSSGGVFTELDRDVIACNSATTDVWFMLRADIAANSTDTSYWLYFANVGAGAPPANRANVYLHFNDWSSNALGSYTVGRMDNWQGTGTYTGFAYDAANQRVNFNTGDNATGGLRLTGLSERDVYVEQTVRYTGCYPADVSQGLLARYSGNGTSSSSYYGFSQSNSSGCQNNPYTSPAIVKGSRTGTVCGSGAGTAWPLDGTAHRIGFAVWGSGTVNLKGWLDAASRKPTTAPALSCTNASTPINSAGNVVWLQAQTAGSFDDFLVRRYTEPEPAVAAAAMEVGP